MTCCNSFPSLSLPLTRKSEEGEKRRESEMSFKKVLSILLFIKFKAAKRSFIMMDSSRRKYTVREISDIIEQRLNTDPLNNICVRGESIEIHYFWENKENRRVHRWLLK